MYHSINFSFLFQFVNDMSFSLLYYCHKLIVIVDKIIVTLYFSLRFHNFTGIWIPPRRGVLDTTLCDKVCKVTCDRSMVFSTNKTDCHDITEILLKVALNTINQPIDHFTNMIFKVQCIYHFTKSQSWLFNGNLYFNLLHVYASDQFLMFVMS
jgi:hypothetical protein